MRLITFVVLAANHWLMADLKAAQAQGSAMEVLEHCQDVPAAQRGPEWREVVGDAAVLHSLEKCVKNDDDECLSWVTPMAGGVSHETALELARVVRRGGYVPYAPMPLVRRAVSGERHDALCADGLVADVTVAALNLPDDCDAAKAAREVAFDFCFPQLQARLKQATAHAEPYTLHNTCKGMRQKNALSPLSSELCRDQGL